jgi:hypothetical protein
MPPSIITESGDSISTVVFNLVNRTFVDIKKSGESMENRQSFYWRLHYYCSAQMVDRSEAFFLPVGGDPNESRAVTNAIQQISIGLSLFECTTAQRREFYAELLGALLAHARSCEI